MISLFSLFVMKFPDVPDIVVAVIPYGADGRPRRVIRRTQMRLAALHSSGLTSIQPPPTYEQTMQNVNTGIPRKFLCSPYLHYNYIKTLIIFVYYSQCYTDRRKLSLYFK